MARETDPRMRHLKRIKGSSNLYVNVRVPRSLESVLGKSHVRKSLNTSNVAEADRRKHAEVARIKAELAALARKHARGEPIERGLTLSSADAIRASLEEARRLGAEDAEFEIASRANEQAHEIAALQGEAAAHKFFRRATRTEETLSDLCDKWLGGSDYKEVTKDAHRESLRGLLAFLEDDAAIAADVSRRVAAAYVESGLETKGLAQRTIRRKLNALSAFWEWLEVKGQAPHGGNPWKGHKISAKVHKGTRPARRIYTDAELLALLNGPKESTRRKSARYMRDLSVLGLFTGARLDELCNLRAGDVEKRAEGYVLRVRDAKTKAGIRLLAVVHEAPCAVVARRLEGAKGGRLFPELKPGGIDGKLSHEASKRFTGYRRACGIADGPTFHTLRNQVATVLERADVPPLRVDRFLGHKTGRLATDVYSAGGSEDQAIDTASKIRYSGSIEAAALLAARA